MPVFVVLFEEAFRSKQASWPSSARKLHSGVAGLSARSETVSRCRSPSAKRLGHRRGYPAFELAPSGLFHGYCTVAFYGKQPTQPVVLHPLQVVYAAVPTVAGHESGVQPPGQDFFQHLAEIVVLGLASDLS